MKNISKIKSYVGFSIKSGKVIFGIDNIIKARPRLIMIDNSLGEASKRKLANYLEKVKIECIELDLSEIVTKENCKAIGLTDRSLVGAINKAIKES